VYFQEISRKTINAWSLGWCHIIVTPVLLGVDFLMFFCCFSPCRLLVIRYCWFPCFFFQQFGTVDSLKEKMFPPCKNEHVPLKNRKLVVGRQGFPYEMAPFLLLSVWNGPVFRGHWLVFGGVLLDMQKPNSKKTSVLGEGGPRFGMRKLARIPFFSCDMYFILLMAEKFCTSWGW